VLELLAPRAGTNPGRLVPGADSARRLPAGKMEQILKKLVE
jgi:hypothetical protein